MATSCGFESRRPHQGLVRDRDSRSIARVSSVDKITISPDLTFDALVVGESGASLVLLLHGFAESLHCWRAQIAALSDMGYRVIAPSQLFGDRAARSA